MYKRDDVLIKTKPGKSSVDDDDSYTPEEKEKIKYYKQSKAEYLIGAEIAPLVNCIFFGFAFFTAKDWADLHAN